MRERRATVRVGCFLPAEYRVAERSLVSPGRITDLSLGGLRLFTSRPLAGGERVTVTFTLPRDDNPVSVHGLIRWSGPASSGDPGCPVGVEFERLDETTRFCVQAFVTDQTKPTSLLKVGWPLLVGIVSAGICVWILQLQRQKEQLRQTLAERTSVITQLEATHQQLAQELDQTKAAASLTATEIGRLQYQRAQLETELGWLNQNLGELKEAYLRVRDERDALQNRVQVLEQQQAAFEQRLTSIPELRKAIRQTAQAEAKQRREQRRRWLARLREADQHTLRHGNRGYVVRDGHPTLVGSRLSIRVLSPESPSESSP